MGIRILQNMNEALLCKWLWRFSLEEESLWRQVVAAEFRPQEGWDPIIPKGPLGRSPWQGIMKLLPLFKAGHTHVVGDGNRSCFWDDVWCRERPLKLEYLEVYSMATDPKALVASYMRQSGGGTVWEPRLRQDAFVWEIPHIVQLLDRLKECHIIPGQVDS